MKKAIVTGSNSEIGLEICKTLLSLDYYVIACIHENKERIKKVENKNLQIIKLDLTNEDEILNLNCKADLIVNVAAYYFDDYFHNITKADFIKTLDVNVVAPFILFKNLLLDNGVMINISSTDGIDTYNEINISYAASKAALNNLTQSLAYARSESKVYALALGWVNTELIRSINQDYLKNEMIRTNQKRLVNIDEITLTIKKILNGCYKTGSIIRIDGE